MASYVGTTTAGLVATTFVDVTRSVTAGGVLVAWYRQTGSNNRTFSLAQTAGTAITFTNRLDTDTTVGANDVVFWTGVAGTTESITLRLTANLSDSGDFGITEISGADTTTPSRGVGSEYNTSAATTHDMLGTGVDVTSGDVVIGIFRLASGTSVTITPPSGATAILTESQRGGVYYREFASGSTGERFAATSGTARTSECGGIVIAGAAAASGIGPVVGPRGRVLAGGRIFGPRILT